ncbi:MAG: AMP-binding protein, partial [Cytophagales bacterium]|nr:AMP-binding protein [Cytophagales bacterium]
NEYGLTECCVDNACDLVNPRHLPDDGVLPIGRPLPNNQLLVVDAHLRLVPVGVVGEIAILGAGVGRGYLNRPELTAARFVDSPYPEAPGKLYLTGDLGKWLPDGRLTCVGRRDAQVKVRGYRVEPGEIEAALRKVDGVGEAVVVLRQVGESKDLVAYWTGNPALRTASIRESLAGQLPAYMVPGHYVYLERLPLTLNGKVNRQALPGPEQAAAGEEEYTAPRNPAELLLAELWQEVLGIPNMSVRRDFFLSGGDSIKAIQISSRLHGLGRKVEVKDIFLHPTIEKLAPYVSRLERIADQGSVRGSLPLTPVQCSFFATRIRAPHHYNQAVLLDYRQPLDPERVGAMADKLLAHHDALRLTFHRAGDGAWVQHNEAAGLPAALRVFDCRSEADPAGRLAREADALQGSMVLEKGPLLQMALFQLAGTSKLLIAAHHLVIDGVSWRILLEDLATLQAQQEQGESLHLPLKTDAYRVWATRLAEYANSPAFLAEKAYWARLEASAAGAFVFPAAGAPPADLRSHSFQLGKADTHLLLTGIHHAFRTEVPDVLLAGLGLAHHQEFGEAPLLLALEGHGREPILPEVNVSRTVGWFTSIFPVLLPAPAAGDLAGYLVAVKEMLRGVPNRGIGYGILQYLTAAEHKTDLRFSPAPRVIFNYLGQFQGLENLPFRFAEESPGQTRSPETERTYSLEIDAIVTGEGLSVTVSYDGRQWDPDRIKRLWDAYLAALRACINLCSERTHGQLTPSDLTYKALGIARLNGIAARYPVEDIYPLSPMQEGILFTCLYNKNPHAYFEQLSYRLQGELEPQRVKESINLLIKRHPILRTAFLYQDLERPLQVVLRERTCDFRFEDLRGAADPEAYLRQFRESDKARAFDLSQDTLLRVALFRLDACTYEFVWSHHHLLMDGWCQGILIKEYYALYNGLLRNTAVPLPAPAPYRLYISWLEKRDRGAARHYWQHYLLGYEQPAVLPRLATAAARRERGRKKTLAVPLPVEVTRQLNALAGQYRVTTNTLVQAIWGILLGRYNNRTDVVFGSVVSGRPAEIPGVESMIGLFINTVPVRVRYGAGDTFASLVKRQQQQALESEAWQYESLSEVQAASSLQAHLLDHIFIFDNYPTADRQL